jgi:SAM-dependent methyltransferase
MRTWDEYAARWRVDNSWVAIEDPTNALPRAAYLRLVGDEWGDKRSVRGFVANFIVPNLAPGAIAVEIGSGGGRIALQAAPHCRWLIALDTSPAMMGALREAAASLRNIVPILMPPGSTRLPVADGSIDLVYSFDVMVHLDQRTIFRYLCETSRALKDGGVAVVHYASCESAVGWKHFVRSVEKGVSQGGFASFEYLHSATMRQMANHVGLAVVDTTIGRRGNFYYERDVVALLRKAARATSRRRRARGRADAGGGDMTIAYRTESEKVVLNTNVTEGTPHENVVIRLYRLQEHDIREEVELSNWKPTFSGNRAHYEWSCASALTAAQLCENYQFEVHDGRTWIARAHVVVYRPTIVIEAVDKDGNAVEGAVCKLKVNVNHLFQPEGERPKRPYDQGFQRDVAGRPLGDHTDERVWIKATDSSGKATFSNLPPGHVDVEWVKPWALTVGDGSGWQIGGGYTLTGPRRKAKVEPLPLVHYIWWGNPATDSQALDASKTPNQLAGLGRVWVHYWRNSADITIGAQPARGREYALQAAGAWDARAALHGGIVVHEVNTTGDPTTEGGGIAAVDIVTDRTGRSELPMRIHPSLRRRGRLINAIVAAMSAYNMRSAVKDFLVLLVLYRYGGWYFDTTTAITEATPGDIVAKLRPVTKAYSADLAVEDELKFVKTRVEGKITLMLDDRSDHHTKMLGQLPKDMPGVVEVDKIDTWGIYAPARHPGILTMIDSYIERAREMGLDRYGLCDTARPRKTAQQQRNHRYLLQDISAITQGANDGEKLEIVKSERIKIIGNINIASVQEGLAKYRAASGRSVADTTIATRYATEAERNAHDVHIVVTSFGIGKRHAGNWRNV